MLLLKTSWAGCTLWCSLISVGSNTALASFTECSRQALSPKLEKQRAYVRMKTGLLSPLSWVWMLWIWIYEKAFLYSHYKSPLLIPTKAKDKLSSHLLVASAWGANELSLSPFSRSMSVPSSEIKISCTMGARSHDYLQGLLCPILRIIHPRGATFLQEWGNIHPQNKCALSKKEHPAYTHTLTYMHIMPIAALFLCASRVLRIKFWYIW